MGTSKIFSEQSIDVSVPLGRLIYQGTAAPGLELTFDEQAKAWLQRRPGEQEQTSMSKLGQALRSSGVVRRWLMPAAVSVALGTLGAAGVWYALHDSAPKRPLAVLPPPVPEPDGLVERVAGPYGLPVAPPGAAASAVVEAPIGIDDVPDAGPLPARVASKGPVPKMEPPKPKAEAPAPAPKKAVEVAKAPAPAPAKAGPPPQSKEAESDTDAADKPIFDAGGITAARGAAPAAPPKPAGIVPVNTAAAVPGVRLSAKSLLAVPSKEWIVATDPSSNLPRRFKVGETLPSGARILSADPNTGIVTTDRGNLRLE